VVRERVEKEMAETAFGRGEEKQAREEKGQQTESPESPLKDV